jgi:hypothetical protein
MPIFEAWPDEGWFDSGTAVRVSLVCFGDSGLTTTRLANQPVALIHADLTAGDGEVGMDLTTAKAIKENAGICFQGPEKNGAFDISGAWAREWLKQPNPNSKPNSDVIKPRMNGIDLTRRLQDIWIIDFGTDMASSNAALYESPFQYVLEHVKPERDNNRDANRKKNWWRFGRTGGDMRAAFVDLPRYIATSAVSKHMFFSWIPACTIPDKALIVIARSDDTTFGILHSRFHELWSLGLCSSLENRPRYTPTTCFETFPFPPGLTPADTAPNSGLDLRAQGYVSLPGDPDDNDNSTSINPFSKPTLAIIADSTRSSHAQAIANAAYKLNQLRENWLNPPEWVDWVITPEEEKAGFPKRPVAKAGYEADLKKRTLTNLYNANPNWLINAHQALDKAVAKAYGWDDYTPEMTDTEILQRLLKLNLACYKSEQSDEILPTKPIIIGSVQVKKA